MSAPPNPPDPRAAAVALAYEAADGAPKVVAKGRGELARKIIDTAREAGVFVHESPELVALLMQIDLDARIPPQLYLAVAELLAWVYRIEREEVSAEVPVTLSLPAGESGRSPA